MSRPKGCKLTEEHKMKLREVMKGRITCPANLFKKGHIPWIKGKKLTEETKRKIGLANAISHKGKKLSEEHKQNLSLMHKKFTGTMPKLSSIITQ